MNEEPLPQSEILLFQTEDGHVRIETRFEDETAWLRTDLEALAELEEGWLDGKGRSGRTSR